MPTQETSETYEDDIEFQCENRYYLLRLFSEALNDGGFFKLPPHLQPPNYMLLYREYQRKNNAGN